jgi:integration host factor subunit beta
MVRSDLVATLLRKNPALDLMEIERIVYVFFEEMANKLEAGGRVELRGFGIFTTRRRQERTGHNPQTGDKVLVPAKRVVHFKPGKEIAIRIRSKSPADQA